MSGEVAQEYDDDLIALLEAVWGEGFMSPGGTDEVDLVLSELDLTGKSVLDIGCGLGGVDVHVVINHGAALVTGIDIEQHLIERCIRLAEKRGVIEFTRFLRVEPGTLPLEDGLFDFVTSKDSIVHIPDKHALADDIHRVLKAGGWFAASDWLAGYEGEPSPKMRAYLDAEGLDFGLASVSTYKDALRTAGFVDVETRDRNDWYRARARQERDKLAGVLYEDLKLKVGAQFLDHEIDVWEKAIVVLDQGDLRPTHLRGRKAV